MTILAKLAIVAVLFYLMLCAALFLFLLVAMLNSFGLDAGYRLILTGLIIISVIVVASGRDAGRRN